MSRKQIPVSILAAAVTVFIAGVSVVWTFPRKTPSSVNEVPSEFSSTLPISGNVNAAQAKSCQRNTGVYSVGGLKGPVAIYCPEPECTTQAMKAHCEGAAVLSCVVNVKGRVTEVQVVKSLGDGFDQNAIKTVHTWRFKPATLKDRLVPARVLVEVHFSMPKKVRASTGNSARRAKKGRALEPPSQTKKSHEPGED